MKANRLIILMISILLLTPFHRVYGAQSETSDTTDGSADVMMEATYGYGDSAKGNRYLPVRIDLDNRQQNPFEGNILVLSMETDFDIYRYHFPISIEAEEKKQETVFIPLGNRADQLYVILQDQSGNEIMRQRLKLNTSADVSELLIGILSDTPQQLQYLDGIGINYSMLRTKTAILTSEIFPSDELGLDLLDVILITNYDTDQLTKAQTQAIMEWVKKGGILLIGTGNRAEDCLGDLLEELIEEPYGVASMMAVDMGVEYATNGPGDSFINIPCVDVSLRGGNVILSNDEFPVLTAVNKEKGKIAVAAYDFVDIAQFCQTQRSYVEKIMVNLLGEQKINQLSDTMYNGDSNRYWSVQSVINTGNVDKLPNVILFLTVIGIYLILVGPGLYLILKKKGLRKFYQTSVLALSLSFTGLIYMMGNKTRFQDTFFTYATIKDVSEHSIKETTAINIRNPYNKPYSVELDPAYSLRPTTRNYYFDMTMIPKFKGTEEPKVNVEYGSEKTTISVKDVVAFHPKYFHMEKKSDNEKKEGFTGNIVLFDGKIYGSVTNHFSYPVENAALLLAGQMVLLNEFQPGQTKQLDGLEVIFFPSSYSHVVAERISGGDQYKKADINDKDYLKALERTNMLIYYLDNYFAPYSQDARIVAFSSEKEETQFLYDETYETYGSTLLTSALNVSTKMNGLTYRTALPKRPAQVSGTYNPDTNTMYGADPVVVEYALGNDLLVDKISFNRLSEYFIDNEKYKYITLFSGTMYFYNYDTGTYDPIDSSQKDFIGTQMRPYLSPSNTITVKYIPEINAEYNWDIMLPMLTIVGKEK